MNKLEQKLSKEVITYNKYMLDSYKRFLGMDLVKRVSREEDSKSLFLVPFVVVSHGIEKDPIFKYGNKKALEVFEIDWEDLIKLPSRLSADPIHQDERAFFLNEVTNKGFIKNYSGIRISSKGKRFKIKDAIVWNVLDENENYIGQAATFDQWEDIVERK